MRHARVGDGSASGQGCRWRKRRLRSLEIRVLKMGLGLVGSKAGLVGFARVKGHLGLDGNWARRIQAVWAW